LPALAGRAADDGGIELERVDGFERDRLLGLVPFHNSSALAKLLRGRVVVGDDLQCLTMLPDFGGAIRRCQAC
jgi:hypothetical protein